MALTSASVRLVYTATVPVGNASAFGNLSPTIDTTISFSPTGTYTADTPYVAGITVGTSATTLDLSGGTITQPGDGGVASFSKLKGVAIQNASTTLNLLINKSGSANAGDFSATLGPGGYLIILDPINGQNVTNSTADKLTLAASSSSIPVNVFIIGPA